jgi:hypothetical protein
VEEVPARPIRVALDDLDQGSRRVALEGRVEQVQEGRLAAVGRADHRY